MDAQKMKMVIGLVLVATAAFALMIPAASAVDDFITRRAYDNLVKSGAINDIPVMAKTIISNPVLEEALDNYYSKHKLGGDYYACRESCHKTKCHTPGCICGWPGLCAKNSLDDSTTADEEAVFAAAFARKALAGVIAN